MNTNFLTLITFAVLTNVFTNSFPSGEYVITRITAQNITTTNLIGTNWIVLSTNYPLSTNYTRYITTWKEVPLKDARSPLGVPDPPKIPKL